MRRIAFILVMVWFLLPTSGVGQTYKQLWDEVAELKLKDMPKSVIAKVQQIYAKGQAEKNLPQMMAAFMVEESYNSQLNSLYLAEEKNRLVEWADTETDSIGKAVLNCMVAKMMADDNTKDVDGLLDRIDQTLSCKALLLATSAADFMPMTVSTDFSKNYFSDNMYDLLSRESIALLQGNWNLSGNPKVEKKILSIYDTLISCYDELNNPEAALLSKEARITYQYQHASYKFRIKGEEAVQAYQGLIDEYSDLDICYDVHIKLAMLYHNLGQNKKAVDLLQSAVKKYRKSSYRKVLNNNIGYISSPYVYVEFDHFYPMKKIPMEVNFKNLKEFTLETYRLDVHAYDVQEKTEDVKFETVIRKYGKRIARQIYTLPGKGDYSNHTAKLTYQTPEDGIYLLKLIPKGRPDGIAYKIIHVSSNVCISMVQDRDKMEMIAVDAESGHPVKNASFVFYAKNGKTRFYRKDTIQANHDGSILIDRKQRKDMFYNVCTDKSDAMELEEVYSSYSFSSRRTPQLAVRDFLFTDRAIYRPGQTVHVSGIRFSQRGDSLHTAEAGNVKLKLQNSNYETVKEVQLQTDDFGTYSYDFVLPQTVLPGNFTVYADHSQITIKVEEYKLPTFDVAFEPYKEAFHFDDSVRVEGKALAFSGAPVRMAKVEYKVVRSKMQMWYRRGAQETVLKQGELMTGSDGKFVIGATLIKPDEVDDDEDSFVYYEYKIEANVTSSSGETQMGKTVLTVGNRSLGIHLEGWEDIVLKEDELPITVKVKNLQLQPVQTEVEYSVFAADDKGKKKELVCKGTAESNRKVVPSDIYALPSGRYVIELTVCDDQGRKSEASEEFTLFSSADRHLPYKEELWLYYSGEEFKRDQPVDLYVGTSERDALLFVDVFTHDGRIFSERVRLDNEIRKYSFNYKKEYGKGIKVNFAIVRRGALYREDVYIQSPKPEKLLNITWKTFRDRLRPGQEEEWVVKVTDKAGKPVQTALLATMYDASLDKIFKRYDRYGLRLGSHWWANDYIYMTHYTAGFTLPFKSVSPDYGLSLVKPELYSQLLTWNSSGKSRVGKIFLGMSRPAYTSRNSDTAYLESVELKGIRVDDSVEEIPDEISEADGQSLRENFNETAFFYPALRTDSMGEANIVFTLPEALTEWNFMAYAHTQNMDYAILKDKVKASKPFMVQPNLPRFIRTGDRTVLSSALINMSEQWVEGRVVMELVNPLTEKVVYRSKQNFSVRPGESGNVDFEYKADGKYDILVCRIMAYAGDFSDGEQHYLPVLKDKEQITETIPVQLDGTSSVNVSLDNLFNKGSKTATHKRLRVELTANPEWQVVKALPYLSAPSYDNALSWMAAYYADAIAMHILHEHPKIGKVLEAWKATNNKEELKSNLQKNQELKAILLEESPWLMEAMTEKEQMEQICMLFDSNAMRVKLNMAIDKLEDMQLEDGSWSWFKGMSGNLFISTTIIESIARLKSLGVELDPRIDMVYTNGLSYLADAAKKEYDAKRKLEKNTGRVYTASETVLRYLYICSIDPFAENLSSHSVNSYFVEKMLHRSADYTIYGKAVMALVMQANGHKEETSILLASLREYMKQDKEMGRYFEGRNAYYSWNDTRIPTQVAAIEALARLDYKAKEITEMQQWLLKQKQVQMWSTTTATVDAVYAFLCIGEKRLQPEASMKAVAGSQVITTPEDAMGFVSQPITDIRTRSIRFSRSGEGIGWGTVYAQCLENVDKVKGHTGKGLSIQREYLVDGQPLAIGQEVKVGDRMKVHLTITADRDMDFVQIKDCRAACMEPVEQLSGYRWTGRMGYYRVSRDASTQFFIDRIRMGTYVLEYDVLIDRPGTYQSGTATIQSAYSPEFTSVCGGKVLKVK